MNKRKLAAFYRENRGLHRWLLALAVILALFYLTRGNEGLMTFVAERVTGPLKYALGSLCALVPFSVAELLCGAALGGGALYLCASAADLISPRGRRRGRILYRRLLGAVCAVLSVYAGFCVLWGVNYYIDGFQEKAGIEARGGTAAELRQVTALFVDKVNARAQTVARDENGFFIVPRSEIYAAAPHIYDALEQDYPFLEMRDLPPKPVAVSRAVSALQFTGFYFPFTGETNLNNDSPACLLPSTIAHELAHQRGIASEQECNFLAVLACETGGNEVYAYSGALFAYIHLSNALYRADRESWEALYHTLAPEAQLDLAYNSWYWQQFEGKTAEISKAGYDQFLKGYGDEDGIRSYGKVVDLLLAYYGEQAEK